MLAATNEMNRELGTMQSLCAAASQWVYFNPDLRIYEGTTTYIAKPMQRLTGLRVRRCLMPTRSSGELGPGNKRREERTRTRMATSANLTLYRAAFIRNCHTLIARGYSELSPRSFRAAQETEITGELVRSIKHVFKGLAHQHGWIASL